MPCFCSKQTRIERDKMCQARSVPGGCLRSNDSANSADRLSAEETIRMRLPMVSIKRPNASGAAACAIRAGAPGPPPRPTPPRPPEVPEPVAIILRPKNRQRQRAARNRQDPVAGAMEDGEYARRSTAAEQHDHGADRVRHA